MKLSEYIKRSYHLERDKFGKFVKNKELKKYG